MMVKFATVCDTLNCKARSEEYTAYPTCVYCANHFCPQHGKITIEADVDQPEQGICDNCRIQTYKEIYGVE